MHGPYARSPGASLADGAGHGTKEAYRWMLLLIFTLSMFISSTLLFLVEPMLAKMLLPKLGGSAALWNTCLMYFQAMLLAGYLYAHILTRRLGRRTQGALHCALVFSPLLIPGLLPLHIPASWEPPAQSNPVPWILASLVTTAGLPFFALSSSTIVMQRWFAATGHKDAIDPYFLYAASNTGSLTGLLAYPLLLEPLLTLSRQSRAWSLAYALFAALTTACALTALRKREAATASLAAQERIRANGQLQERLRWTLLAFIPSSLMLGVTTALTTDVPAMPLFWVLPLTAYLLSFVLVFSKRPLFPQRLAARLLPMFILIALFPALSRMKFSFALLMTTYLMLLFAAALVFHGELARTRPETSRLSEFYLWISTGGVLGGLFNAILSPLLFHSALEFPLVLILAALVYPRLTGPKTPATESVWSRRNDWLMPAALGGCMAGLILATGHWNWKPGFLVTFLFFAYSMLWCISFRKRPLRFALGISAMLIACQLYTGPYGQSLDTERSFFGVVRVTNDPSGRYRFLIHNGTLHGLQSLDAARSRESLGYYTGSGPAGQLVRAVRGSTPNSHWAVVGLGVGSMACLLEPGEALSYYEIDPLVVRVAENPRYFTFLSQCAPQAKIVLGDARLKLQDATDGEYELIALDAFNGDSIPLHLLTREALALYLRKLAPDGLLAFHISSNYLQLGPTLGTLAADAHLACFIEEDTTLTQAQVDAGKLGSRWVVMARRQADVSNLIRNTGSLARWVANPAQPRAAVWTDDYSNLLSLMH